MTLGLSRDPSSVPASASPAVARTALVAVALGSLMTALDVTALNVALPGIGHAFAVGIDRLQWIAGAYPDPARRARAIALWAVSRRSACCPVVAISMRR